MGTSCTFLGNDYGLSKPQHIKEYIEEQIVKLITLKQTDTFYVGEKGAYEKDAYDTVLQIQPKFPHIKIILVIATEKELNTFEENPTERKVYRRAFDGFEYPLKAELGYKRWCIVHRNNWMIEHSDYIISYNKRKGRAFSFCKKAQNKGKTIIELTEIYTFDEETKS